VRCAHVVVVMPLLTVSVWACAALVGQTPEFERYLERLKIKQENEVYERMVRGTKSQKFTLLGDDMNDPNRPQSQSIRSQLSIGVNVIAAMFTGFCAGYYAGRSMFPNSPIWVRMNRPPTCGFSERVLPRVLFCVFFSFPSHFWLFCGPCGR
jgi:hypothetical protein